MDTFWDVSPVVSIPFVFLSFIFLFFREESDTKCAHKSSNS